MVSVGLCCRSPANIYFSPMYIYLPGGIYSYGFSQMKMKVLLYSLLRDWKIKQCLLALTSQICTYWWSSLDKQTVSGDFCSGSAVRCQVLKINPVFFHVWSFSWISSWDAGISYKKWHDACYWNDLTSSEWTTRPVMSQNEAWEKSLSRNLGIFESNDLL